ncbi:MerR family DNA-binding protein [Streptomyces sp. NPDC058701]|uniref:MerR family DNA-binding protein n=1 Tax=Streptomyces sp. NPDC058701 TaxID=3346608 RepID=UPI00364BE4DC
MHALSLTSTQGRAITNVIELTSSPGGSHWPFRRVALISVAKRIGIPLQDLREAFADVPLDRPLSHQEWQRASRSWKRRLEERRQTIERLEAELTGCIGCGCLSMKACALLNPGDALAQDGVGPRRL